VTRPRAFPRPASRQKKLLPRWLSPELGGLLMARLALVFPQRSGQRKVRGILVSTVPA